MKTYNPWTAGGAPAPGIEVGSTVHGSCFSTSLALDTDGVYRCMAGDDLYDPCFIRSDANEQLACASSPWAKVTLFDLTASLPVGDLPDSGPPSVPWAVELANGARCVLGTGANSTIDGVTLEYYCGTRAETGSVQQTGQLWTVQYAPTATATGLTSVAVLTAWI